MGILDGFVKTKKYRKTSSGYKLQSEWTSSETVQYKNGLTLEESEVYLTQEEYDALGDEKLSNGVKYYITDADANPGQNSNMVEIEEKTYTATTNDWGWIFAGIPLDNFLSVMDISGQNFIIPIYDGTGIQLLVKTQDLQNRTKTQITYLLKTIK